MMRTDNPEKTIEVPGYSGRAIDVNAGDYFRIIDVEGAQVGDLFAISRTDHFEYLSTAVTRLVNLNLFPKPGQAFYSTKHRPIIMFVEDQSPGIHDMLFAPCDRELYKSRGMSDHPNCRENYLTCAGEMGIIHSLVPDPVNLFQNTPPQVDGSLEIRTTVSHPGNYVLFCAQMDIIIVLTACSSERINNGKSTPLRIEVLRHK